MLVNAQAVLLDTLSSDNKKTISKSALVDTRRCFRQNAASLPILIDIALANAQTCTPSYRNAVLIGAMIDTSIRLKDKTVNGRQMVATASGKLTDYYVKNVVSSRTVPLTPVLDAFRDFVHEFVSKEQFMQEFVPVLDKMILRSPEVALRGMVIPLLLR